MQRNGTAHVSSGPGVAERALGSQFRKVPIRTCRCAGGGLLDKGGSSHEAAFACRGATLAGAPSRTATSGRSTVATKRYVEESRFMRCGIAPRDGVGFSPPTGILLASHSSG